MAERVIEHLWHFWIEPSEPDVSGVLCFAAGQPFEICKRGDCESKGTLHITNEPELVSCRECIELMHA